MGSPYRRGPLASSRRRGAGAAGSSKRSQMRRTVFAAIALGLLLGDSAVAVVSGERRGTGGIIDFGRSDAPGVQATAVRVYPPRESASRPGARMSGAPTSSTVNGVPAPV